MIEPKLFREDMHGHQVKVSDFIYERKTNGAMCWLDVGGGKTVSSLDAIARMDENFCFGKALVVSTKRIVKDVWPDEIKLWEQTNHMVIAERELLLEARRDRNEPEYVEAKELYNRYHKIIKRKGSKRTPKDRLKKYRRAIGTMRKIEAQQILAVEADIYLINVDNFRWLVDTLGSKWPFDTVIFDEFSLFRNNDSRRFKAAKRIRPHITTVIGLTGSPAPNGYMGLWAQAYLIDQGASLGQTITGYRDNYFVKHYDGFSWRLKPGAKQIIQDKIKHMVISLDPRDYMELGPEPIHEEYKLKLPAALEKQYKKLERDFFLEVDGNSILAPTEAVKSNKLRQFCNGTVYAINEEGFENKKKVIQIHDLKLECLREVVEILDSKPLIVAYEFIPEREKILKAFPQAITIDKFNQKKWDRGEIPIIVMHPRSGGHGMNLQHGGHHVFWFPTMIDLELYNQLNGRVGELRQAQSGYFRPPIYWHCFFENTVEEDLIRRRNQKDADEKQLIKAMMKGVSRRCQDAETS